MCCSTVTWWARCRGCARTRRCRCSMSGTASTDGNVPMVWDPHPRGPEPVHGVRLATPNEAELRRLAGDHATDGLAAVAAAGQLLCQRWRAGAVAVTRGADGALLCRPGMAP